MTVMSSLEQFVPLLEPLCTSKYTMDGLLHLCDVSSCSPADVCQIVVLTTVLLQLQLAGIPIPDDYVAFCFY
jgi:hypothetical protein